VKPREKRLRALPKAQCRLDTAPDARDSTTQLWASDGVVRPHPPDAPGESQLQLSGAARNGAAKRRQMLRRRALHSHTSEPLIILPSDLSHLSAQHTDLVQARRLTVDVLDSGARVFASFPFPDSPSSGRNGPDSLLIGEQARTAHSDCRQDLRIESVCTPGPDFHFISKSHTCRFQVRTSRRHV